ncbi:hypothetical protein [Nonomuraea sp. NPDC049784]|uniref:hypothetical protein n=1 Tax=Nonomuraea sp. NPDC049784 TaxID=3154361 RepID=UPI0033F709FB
MQFKLYVRTHDGAHGARRAVQGGGGEGGAAKAERMIETLSRRARRRRPVRGRLAVFFMRR